MTQAQNIFIARPSNRLAVLAESRADDPRVQPIAFATRDEAEKHLLDLARETAFEDVVCAGEEYFSLGINFYGVATGVELWAEQAKDNAGRGIHGTKVGSIEIVALGAPAA